jgi:hypothetical protein
MTGTVTDAAAAIMADISAASGATADAAPVVDTEA